jgi:PhnB protein
MAIQGGRPNNRQVVPYLFVRDGEKALDFYRRAFGAEVLYKAAMPGGKGIFAQVRIGETVLQVADEASGRKADMPAAPESLGGTSVILEMYVDDVDAAYQKALDAGGQPAMRPMDMFFGDRYSWIADPFGHLWALATVKEELTADEIQRRMDEYLTARH